MRCPTCPTRPLDAVAPEPGLSAHSCASCAGMFLLSSDYLSWVTALPANAPEQEDAEPAPQAGEPGRARCCPFCQHIFTRYKIGLNIPFTIDHCGHCNSMWLDAGEWESLRRRNLHDDLNHMFTEAWQRRLRAASHRAAMAASYAARFGSADYAEARRIKAWLNTHPHVQALRTYLLAEDPYA